jgi:hypothetical protein
MAFINIKGAKVGKKLGEKGFEVVESWEKQDDSVVKTFYKVWTEEFWAEGLTVDVSGIVSFRAELYEGEARGSISVNRPTIKPALIVATKPAAKLEVSTEDSPF